MKFLNYCLLSFVFMIAPLKATDQLDIDDIKKEFQTFREKIISIESEARSPHSQNPLSQAIYNKYQAIIGTIDKKIKFIETLQKDPENGSNNTYLEELLEAHLSGKSDYISTINKVLILKKNIETPVIFTQLDFQNYLLSSKLIKYFYQQTSLQNLTEKTKVYLSISETLWLYLQDKEKISKPTIGDFWKEASLFTMYLMHKVLPENIFPPLRK